MIKFVTVIIFNNDYNNNCKQQITVLKAQTHTKKVRLKL